MAWKLRRTLGLLCSIVLLQRWAFVPASAQLEEFQPAGGSEFVGEDQVQFRWTNLLGWTVTLLYRTDQMDQWDTLARSVTTNQWEWTVPLWRGVDSVWIRFHAERVQPPILLFTLEQAHDGEIRCVQFDPSGRYVLSVGKDFTAKVWDLPQRQAVAVIPSALQAAWQGMEETALQGLFWHSVDTVLLTVGRQLVRWLPFQQQWDFLPMIGVALAEDDFIRSLAAWQDQLVFGTDDGVLVWLRFAKGVPQQAKVIQQFTPPRIYKVVWSPTGDRVFAVGSDGRLYEYRLPAMDVTVYQGQHGQGSGAQVIWACDVSPDGTRVVTGGVDRTCRVWSVPQQQLVETLLEAQGHIRAVQWAPVRQEFFFAGLEGLLRQKFWSNGQPVAVPWQPIDHQTPILTAAYSPTGDTIATAGRQEFVIRFWRNGQQYVLDTVFAYSYRLPLCLALPVVVTVPERTERIPVLLRCPPPLYREQDSVMVQMVLPSALLYPYRTSFGAVIRYGTEHDTLYWQFDPAQFAKTDTLGWIIARVLHGPPRSDSLLIAATVAAEYRDRHQNGRIVLQDSCAAFDSVAIVNSAVRLTVKRYGALIRCQFVVPYDVPYRLLLLDNRGMRVQSIAAGVQAVTAEKTVSFRHIPAGLYWIVLQTPYHRKVQPVWWMP